MEDQTKRIRRGTIAPNGLIFWRYSKGREVWVTPEKFALKQSQRDKSWNFDNREKCREAERRWRARNPEKAKEKVKRWLLADPVRAAAHIANKHHRRRQRTTGRGVTATEWKAIKTKSGGRCYYCGSVSRLTMDHVIPLSKGGKHEAWNIVPACKPCNSKKGAADPEKFAATIGRLLV